MKVNKKLLIALSVFGVAVIGALVATVSVLAARTVSIETNSVTIKFNARKVVGDIIADRQVFSLNASEEVSGQYLFSSSDSTFKNMATAALSGEEVGANATKVNNLTNSDVITLSDTTFTLIKYTFVNAKIGESTYSSYSAKLDCEIDDFDNVLVSFYTSDDPNFDTTNDSLTLVGTLNGTNYSDGTVLSDLTSTGFTIQSSGNESTSKYVYMVVRVDNLDIDASLQVDFTWNLNAISTATRVDESSLQYLEFTQIGDTNTCSVALKSDAVLPANTAIVIPSIATVNSIDCTVTKIERDAFENCVNMTSVKIPNTVTEMDMDSFNGCTGLTSIVIPNSVTEIPEGLFDGCTGLVSVTFSNSLTELGGYVFQNCTSLQSVTLPDSLLTIGQCAFSGCTGLTSFNIPKAVTTIEAGVFAGIDITSLTVDSANATYYSYENGIYLKSNNSLVRGCKNTIIKAGTTSISMGAFCYSSQTSITIPSSVTEICEQAIIMCSSLVTMTVESGNTVYYSEGNGIYLKSDDSLVVGCNATVIKAGATKIANYALNGCTGLTTIVIPSSMTEIGEDAFNSCDKLESVDFSNATSLVSIKSYAFYGCTSLESVDLSSATSLESIGGGVFGGCTSLESVDLSSATSLESLGDMVFSGCTSLQSVDLSGATSLESIGRAAFIGCTSLATVTMPTGTTWNVASDSALTNVITTLSASNITAEHFTTTYDGKYWGKVES